MGYVQQLDLDFYWRHGGTLEYRQRSREAIQAEELLGVRRVGLQVRIAMGCDNTLYLDISFGKSSG